ncbi:MAG: cell division protein ZapA [Clostridia bacterium]|nr:cell division protein ZapA [Clostridia bacterium]
MKERRIILNICGVQIPLITNESEEYIKSLEKETSELVKAISSTRLDISALTAALSFLDERNKLKAELLCCENKVIELQKEIELIKAEIKPEKEIEKVKNPIRELFGIDNENYKAFYLKDESLGVYEDE